MDGIHPSIQRSVLVLYFDNKRSLLLNRANRLYVDSYSVHVSSDYQVFYIYCCTPQVPNGLDGFAFCYARYLFIFIYIYLQFYYEIVIWIYNDASKIRNKEPVATVATAYCWR